MRAVALPVLAVFALATGGCPQSIATPGETDGATSEDAMTGNADATTLDDATAHEDATTEVDSGQPADAGSPADAEPPDAGGPINALTWSQMTVPPNTRIVECVWGRSSSEIYAGTSNGQLMSFDPANGWMNVWHEPSNFGIHAIWGTTNKLFVASDTTLHVHSGGIQTTPQSLGVGRWIYDLHGLGDNEVYIVADTQNGRGLFKYDGDSVDSVIEPDNVATLAAVYTPSAGRIFVGGNGHLFRYESFTLFDETVEWPATWNQNDILNFTFYDISPAGSRLFAMGSRYLIFERDATGTWKRVHEPFLTDSLQSSAGFENEAYAVGANVTGGAIVRNYQGTWTADQYNENVDLWDVWAAGPDEYFAVGGVNNTFDGIILRGTR